MSSPRSPCVRTVLGVDIDDVVETVSFVEVAFLVAFGTEPLSASAE